MAKKLKKMLVLLEVDDKGDIVRLRHVNQDNEGKYGFGAVPELTVSDRNQLKNIARKIAEML